MHLNPYGRDAVLLATELVNDPPSTGRELIETCRATGLVVDRTESDDVERTRDVLARWVRIVDAPEPGRRAELTNELLAEFCSHPRLTDHAETGHHLHFREANLPVGRVLCSLIAMGTAMHLAGRGMHRLGRCAVEGRDRVFADVSRTGGDGTARRRAPTVTRSAATGRRSHREGEPSHGT